METADSKKIDYLIILAVWVIFIVNGSFSTPLIPPDEPKYAFAAQKMIETGDYITPAFNCQPRFDKPPLIYWAIAGSFMIFGRFDWAARVPSLVATLGVFYLIYLFSMRKFGRKAALTTVAVFATFLHVIVMGRAVAPEMLMVFFSTAALMFFEEGRSAGEKRYIRSGYAALALAFLTKGPVGVIIPLSVILLYALFLSDVRKTLRLLFDPAGIIIFSVIAFPWYIAMLQIHGRAYFDEFFLYHNLDRFTGKAKQHPFHFYYYLPLFLGSLYLWLPFLPEVIKDIRAYYRSRNAAFFFFIWTAFVLIFFTVSVNKLHNYILISYPAVAIVIGLTLSRLTNVTASARKIMLALLLLEITAMIYLFYHFQIIGSAMLFGGLIVTSLSAYIVLKSDAIEAVYAIILMKAIVIILIASVYVGTYFQNINPVHVMAVLESKYENKPLFFYKKPSEDFVFYTNKCISIINNESEMRDITQKNKEVILLGKEKDLDDLKDLNKEVIIRFKNFREKSMLLTEIKSQ